MTREELAARIFAVSCYKGGKPCADSFAQADKFLAYAAKQREPKACEHEWGVSPLWLDFKCVKCGAPKVKPEPQKPERVAREWWIRYPVLKVGGACVPEVWPDSDKHANIFENDTWIKVREILPEDEHDKR